MWRGTSLGWAGSAWVGLEYAVRASVVRCVLWRGWDGWRDVEFVSDSPCPPTSSSRVFPLPDADGSFIDVVTSITNTIASLLMMRATLVSAVA